MKNLRKIIVFLFCISIFISLIFIIDIYAKYLSATNGTATIPIARWNIVVNNNSIRNGSDISNSIQPIFPGNNNIASNIIAPTAEGYFDLNFDFSSADVSFRYDILVEPNENSSVLDLIPTCYSIDNGPLINLNSDSNTITDTILYSSNISTRTIRIYVMWDDSNTSLMNNIQDTQAAISTSSNALIDVSISLTQVADSNTNNVIP
ncbi:MAG: hypothetical protein Q4G09_02495 [Clostridia bacterium]|nr:hypothetical protein [Clostridia bacterium]